MIRVFVMLILSCSMALASDDITCEKKSVDNHNVHCKAKKALNVTLVSINGGECFAPSFHWHDAGDFTIPGTKDCFYVRSVTLSVDGKNKTFAPL